MKIKSLALVATALIAAAGTTAVHAAPDAGCGAGSCAKKAKGADKTQCGCAKKEAQCDKDAGCSKKDGGCAKK